MAVIYVAKSTGKSKKKTININDRKTQNAPPDQSKLTPEQVAAVQDASQKMYDTLVANMPAGPSTSWYTLIANVVVKIAQQNRPAVTLGLPAFIRLTMFSPAMKRGSEYLILFCRLITALSEAIVENACAQGTIDALDVMLTSCLNTLQANGAGINYINATAELGARFIGPSDVLVRERMCTLWVALFLCASKEYSRYVIAAVDTFNEPFESCSVQSIYEVQPKVRETIRNMLKPFLRPEWLEQPSCATTTKHMANLLHYIIRRIYDVANLMQGENATDHVTSIPHSVTSELKRAFQTGKLSTILRFTDPGEERTACLFGLYHLACQKFIWLDSWMGVTFLAAQLFHTPLRYTIQCLYTDKTADEALFSRIRPIFSLFAPPQSSDSSAPSDPEQVRMQQILHFFGLRFYDQAYVETVRTQAESAFQDFLTVFEPESDLEAGALAAVSFLSIHMQMGTSYRIAAVNALSASAVAQANLRLQRDSLQQKADRQQNYADDLTRANAMLERENQKLQQQIEDLQADKRDLQQQVHDLLDLFNTEDGEEDATQMPTSFPADLSPCNALLYGGTPGFQTELRKLLPDLRVMESSTRIDKSALGKADIVFIAVTHFGHSLFDSIMNFCRPNHIPVKPILSTSAKGAAVHIVKEVQMLQAKQALNGAQQ